MTQPNFLKQHRWGYVALALLLLAALFIENISHGMPKQFSGNAAMWNSALPVAKIETPSRRVVSFSISFDALATSDMYNNFFQTSDSAQAIRMELQNPNSLYIALGETRFARIDDAFALNKWHHITITGEMNKSVTATMNGKLVFESDDKNIARLPYFFDVVRVGTGFSQQRPFAGEIKNFKLDSTYETPSPYFLLQIGIAVLMVLLTLWIYWPKDTDTTNSFTWTDLGILFGSIALVGLGLLLSYLGVPPGKWWLLLCLLPFFAVLPISASIEHQEKYIKRRLAIAVLLGLTAIVCVALSGLQNWQHVTTMLQDHLTITTFISCAVLGIVYKTLCYTSKTKHDRPLYMGLFSSIPFLIFAFLSLRADMLFMEGTAMHWEYFVGPIRTLKEGGWLLWDTPSQYGFLNILLASLIPTASAWDAFYIFQSVILMASSSLFYNSLHRHLRFNALFACLIVTTSFFLAWPTLIGPTPFPSSSAVRFFACYVLLYWCTFVFFSKKSDIFEYIKRGAVLWVFGVLWSAESAIYATAIYLAPIALHILIGLFKRTELRDIWHSLFWPIGLFTCTILAIYVAYWHTLGHGPDLNLFWLYATSYSAGFGELPISAFGPVWVYPIIVAIGGISLFRSVQHSAVVNPSAYMSIAAMATIFIISSYYIGRAVPNNIVAQMPLLCFALLIMLRANKLQEPTTVSATQTALALPILGLAIIAPISNPTILDTLTHINIGPASVSKRLPIADTELGKLLQLANIKDDDAVLYYGFDAAMPRKDAGMLAGYEKTWLPVPLQLLEEPISTATRALIIKRYIVRNPKAGYFIQRLGEREPIADAWIHLLQETHRIQQKWANSHYRILYFVPQ